MRISLRSAGHDRAERARRLSASTSRHPPSLQQRPELFMLMAGDSLLGHVQEF